MRAWLGWITAALLVALACTGGPDALDTATPPTHAKVASGESAGKRDPQVRDDDLDVRHQIVDHRTPGHHRFAGLPPSPQTAAPVPVRGVQAAPDVAPATIAGTSRRPRLGACSPEALQIFRC